MDYDPSGWPSSSVTMRPVSDLVPYARNARKHSDSQINQVAASIREWGWTMPILARPDGTVIAGHCRLLAAQKLGIDTAPVMTAKNWTEAQMRAYVLADNQLTLNASWDADLIAVELSDLDANDFDISLIGFSDAELLSIQNKSNDHPVDDEPPQIDGEPTSIIGDVWLLGNHRIACGDATDADQLNLLMNGSKADLCFTSPPYNVGALNIKSNVTTHNKYKNMDDQIPDDDYLDLLGAVLENALDVCQEVFVNIGMVENNKKTIFDFVCKYRDRFKDVIFWEKSSCAPHIQPGVINNLVELVLCFGDGKRKFKNAQFSQGTYWNVIKGNNASGNEFSSIHKATFPIYLPFNIVSNFSKKNGIVLDCFAGTGTTIIACEHASRRGYGMDIEPSYVDVCIKRWQSIADASAIHEQSGKTFEEVEHARKEATAVAG